MGGIQLLTSENAQQYFLRILNQALKFTEAGKDSDLLFINKRTGKTGKSSYGSPTLQIHSVLFSLDKYINYLTVVKAP